MRIDTKLNNIDNAGERTAKYVKYFNKELQQDKVMMGLLSCVCLLVIVIVIGFMLDDKST